jgi:hypothetical protein
MEVMKNIHVLPTEKPSRFHTWINDKGLRVTLYEQPQLDIKSAKNIYITSDEEIKDGDKSLLFVEGFEPIILTHFEPVEEGYEGKKIILTDNKDLIADGVQAIDDEFLEWFVKNPSFEEVEVADLWREGNPSTHDSYQLVIPQEEPKEEQTKCYCGHTITCDCGPLEEPKQETLEEVAENEASIFYEKGTIEWNKYRQVFELGAKWQSERSYNEEEVNNMFATLKINSVNNVATITNVDLFISSWKKQFKKK